MLLLPCQEYVVIVACLTVANVFVRPSYLSFLWAAIPWALILALQWLITFDKIPFLNGAIGKDVRSKNISIGN